MPQSFFRPVSGFIAPFIAAAAALGTPLATMAQTASQPSASAPVNITGQRLADEAGQAAAPRKDVSRVCPAVHTELPEALASAWQAVNTSGVVRMRFTLEGKEVVAAHAVGGPRAYHRWVRTAIHSVQCQSDRNGRQVFEVALRFADPSELGANKVALLGD